MVAEEIKTLPLRKKKVKKTKTKNTIVDKKEK